LQNSLNTLNETRAYVVCDQSMIDKMAQIRTAMLSSVIYIDEIRALKEEG